MATHSEVKKIFRELVENGGLRHAYLFFGEDWLGQLRLAREMAGFLETGKWEEAAGWLDTAVAGQGIDEIRTGIKFLWQKPLKSSRKTLMVPAAENLTLEAQNAILKIAEDPPPHALLLLTCRNPEALLPTLASRLQKIYVATPTPKGIGAPTEYFDVKEFLRADGKKRSEIIKSVIDDREAMEGFVTGLIAELRRDKIKNWRALKELLGRWTLINQYNTNKKLQLEAALLSLERDG